MRLYHLTGNSGERDQAEQTLETFASGAEQYGIFAATYAIAVLHLLGSPSQVVVVGEDTTAEELYQAAVASFAFGKSTFRLTPDQVHAANLPGLLAATLPALPPLKSGRSFAVVCSGSSCQPPVFSAADLRLALADPARK
jgi:uncharacterized protein